MLRWVNHERLLEIRDEVTGPLHEGEAPKFSFILILMSPIKILIRSHSTQNSATVHSFSLSLEIFLDINKHILLKSSLRRLKCFLKFVWNLFFWVSRCYPCEVGICKESISKILTGNRFPVIIRIFSPKSCKQCLLVKREKVKLIRAENPNALKTKMHKLGHKLRQLQTGKERLSQEIDFIGTPKLTDASGRATQQTINAWNNTPLWLTTLVEGEFAFATMATSLYRAPLNVVTRVNKNNSTLAGEKDQNTLKNSTKIARVILHGENHVLNVTLHITLVTTFIFPDIQRVKSWLFNKSNSVSFMWWWYIYYSMLAKETPHSIVIACRTTKTCFWINRGHCLKREFQAFVKNRSVWKLNHRIFLQ